MSELINKYKEILESKDFNDKVANMSTMEELCEYFNKNGVSTTIEETEEICKIIDAEFSKLNETDLDNVTGGLGLTGTLLVIGGGAVVSYIGARAITSMVRKRTGVCHKF